MEKILVLGPGCAKCNKLYENVTQAIRELEISCDVEKITNINEITSYDVLMTPALVIDGKVKSSGSALNVEKVKSIITET
jgi:small redox-active disulfide protein 2